MRRARASWRRTRTRSSAATRSLLKKKEASYRRAMGDKKIPRLSARQSALQLDQEKWENDRLQASGVLVSSGGEVAGAWGREA